MLFKIIFERDSGSKIRPIGIITNRYCPQKPPETNPAPPESQITKEFVTWFLDSFIIFEPQTATPTPQGGQVDLRFESRGKIQKSHHEFLSNPTFRMRRVCFWWFLWTVAVGCDAYWADFWYDVPFEKYLDQHFGNFSPGGRGSPRVAWWIWGAKMMKKSKKTWILISLVIRLPGCARFVSDAFCGP